MSKRVTFLINVPRGARRVVSAASSGTTGRGPMAKKHKHKKRNPPHGYKTWGAYMASIRPGGKKKGKVRRKTSTSRAVTVAKKRTTKRHHHKASKTRTYKRRRTNPPMFGKMGKHLTGNGPVAFAAATVGRSLVGITGEVVVRKLRGLAKQAPGTVVGSLIEGTLGLVLGYGLSLVHHGAGVAFAQGAVSAPMRTAIQQRAIPHISDSLGDDGYLMGPGTGVTLISAYPDDYSGVVQGEDGEQSLGRYVQGDQSGTMGAYVAGAINNAA